MRAVLILILVLNACGSSTKQSNNPCEDCIYTPEDITIFEEVVRQLTGSEEASISELVVQAGRTFLGTPYVPHTLEIGDEEKLVINLREMDCTTYAENCLAMARTLKSREHTFGRFAKELKFIRYRNGELTGYPSRLHYFSDWIYNNQEKGVVRDLSGEFGGDAFSKELNFMSTHPDSYERIRKNPSLLSVLAEQENGISAREMYFIPEEKIRSYEDLLNEGDIVGITTSIEGLAIMHVGILVQHDDQIHLMHASSDKRRTSISEMPLDEYLQNNKKSTGIMLARPASTDISTEFPYKR